MNNATEFTNWLKSNEMTIYLKNKFGYPFMFIKLAKSPDIEYLFCQDNYRGDVLTREKPFQYAGIYCRRDELIYDAQYSVREVEPDAGILGKSEKDLLSELINAVRQRVEAAVGNDRKNLAVSELTDPMLTSRLEDIREYGAAREARDHFLDTEGVDPPTYRCFYHLNGWKEDSLPAYILDPEGFADREAAAYLEEKQQEILYDRLCSELVQAEYQALFKDTDNPVHYVKRIIQAVRASKAKTVRVTILKNGVEFTFKTEVCPLCRDCTNGYGTWQMEAPDRRKFQKAFGRSAEYRPEEIVRITYGRSVLYQREGKSDDEC